VSRAVAITAASFAQSNPIAAGEGAAGFTETQPTLITLPPPAIWNTRIADAVAEWQWKLSILAPALEFPKRSKGRGMILADLANRTHVGLDGKPTYLSSRNLRRWLETLEEDGETALARKRRADAHGRRCFVSRTWDLACPLPEPEKRRIASEIDTYVRSLWAAGIPGCGKAEALATSKLLELSRTAGWSEANADACRVGRHLVERHRDAQIVAIKERDAKHFFDHYTPRIRRSREGLRPLDIVVGDVHPIDILVTRADGSQATPRLIAWLDLATNDVHTTLVLLDKGRGVRQEHIARSFVAMVQEWGLPRAIYLDNGSEYQWEEMMEGFRALIGLTQAFEVFIAEAVDIACLANANEPKARLAAVPPPPAVTRAKPYNAPAKQIEGIFAALEKCFAVIPGWIGGNRMQKRTHRVGAAPKPYPGDWADFESDFAATLTLYRNSEQRGSLKGHSPHQAWSAFIAAGWKPLAAPYEVFLFAFATTERPKVKPGGIQVGGAWYYHDALVPLIGKYVEVRYAKWDASRVLLIRSDGPPIAVPQAHEYHVQDRAGAKEQGRRAGLLNAHVKDEKSRTDKVDLLAEVRRHNAAQAPAPAMPKGPQIAIANNARAAVQALQEAPPAEPARRLMPGELLNSTTGEILRMNVADAAPAPAPLLPLALPPPQMERPVAAPAMTGLDAALIAEFSRNPNDKESS